MKIAFALTQSLDSPSGLGRFGPLARELVRLGHEVEVFALHYAYGSLSERTFVDRGVRVRYVSQMHVQKVGSRKLYYGPVKLLALSMAATYGLARALAQSKAEIIQICKPQPFNTLAARFSRRGRPIYCDCDDYEAETNLFTNNLQRKIVRYFEDGIVKDARALTVNTRYTQARYESLGFPAERIVFIPNGVDRARFNPRPDFTPLRQNLGIDPGSLVIVYVGTLGLQSHPVDLLLEAFVEVIRQLPQARLLLVGGGEDYDLLRQKANELGIEGQTIFAGRVAPDEVPAYLALATVSVDPVHDDLIACARSPLKVLESLALGVPVVTSDVGDRRELLEDGQLGVLVAPGDSNALANGILSSLGNPQTQTAMSNAASTTREPWYWDNLVNEFVQVYEL